MPPPPIIRRPPPADDQPKPWTVAAVAVVGLAAGLLLAARVAPAEDRATSPPKAGSEPPAAEHDPAEVPAKMAEPPPEPEPSDDDGATKAATSEPKPRTAKPAAGAPSALTQRVIEPGRVAYLVCEGVPLRQGPYPCPRDLELEESVWNALDALPECPTAPTGTGQVDVRLHYEGSQDPEIRFLPAATDLDIPSLSSCLDPSLRKLHSALGASSLVVSFRFRIGAKSP